MCLSCTVTLILSVKNCRDLEIWVKESFEVTEIGNIRKLRFLIRIPW